MRKPARIALGFLIAGAALKAAAAIVARVFEGDRTASDDDFKLLAVMKCKGVRSEADSLRTGSATAFWGCIDIDLRDAMLDPGGAHLALKAVMGSIRLTVPNEWRVDVESDAKGAGIEIETADPAEANDQAPRLFIEAYSRWGGTLIRAAEGSRHAY